MDKKHLEEELFKTGRVGTKLADAITSLKTPFKMKHKVKLALYDNLGRFFELIYKIISFLNIDNRFVLNIWIKVEKRKLTIQKEMAKYLEEAFN